MAGDELRVGLAGCGGIGNEHLKVWQKTPGARVVAVCDVKPERAEKAGEMTGAQVFTDYLAMLEKADIEAVDICTWSGLHAEQGIMAAERGLHVLTEKPIDLNLERIDKLIATARAKKVKLACVFQYRCGSQIRRAKELIDEGKLGTIISCSTYVKWWRAQEYYDSDTAWRGTWQFDGGVLSNQGIHSIDQMCWLAGPVAEVEYAHIGTVAHRMEAEDFAIAVVRFESGARGVVEGTTAAYPGLSTRTEIFGTMGSAVFHGDQVESFKVRGEEIDLSAKDERVTDGRADPLAIGMAGHAAQLLDFVQCIREDREPLVTGESARVSVDALNKIYRKAGVSRLGVG